MAAEDTTQNKNERQAIGNTEAPQNNPTGFSSLADERGAKSSASKVGRVKNRKKLYIVGSVALVLVAALVGAWLYYTNPQKVMADAMAKSIAADTGSMKGKAELTFKDQNEAFKKATVDFNLEGDATNTKIDTKSKITVGAVDINVDASIFATKDDSFFKISNAKQLSEAIASASAEAKAIVDMYKPLIDKVDNKWIKIDEQEQSVTKCSKALSEFALSKSDEKNVKKLFRQNQFVKATKTSGGPFGQHHFELGFDEKAGEKFIDETIKLESFKKIKDDCNAETAVKDAKEEVKKDEGGDKPTVKAELWADRWSHKPKKLALTVEDKEAVFTLTTNINLDAKLNLTKPTDATPLSELMKDFQNQFIENLQQSTGGIDPSMLEGLESTEL